MQEGNRTALEVELSGTLGDGVEIGQNGSPYIMH
jgi:hypothetical protein